MFALYGDEILDSSVALVASYHPGDFEEVAVVFVGGGMAFPAVIEFLSDTDWVPVFPTDVAQALKANIRTVFQTESPLKECNRGVSSR